MLLSMLCSFYTIRQTIKVITRLNEVLSNYFRDSGIKILETSQFENSRNQTQVLRFRECFWRYCLYTTIIFTAWNKRKNLLLFALEVCLHIKNSISLSIHKCKAHKDFYFHENTGHHLNKSPYLQLREIPRLQMNLKIKFSDLIRMYQKRLEKL